MMNTDLIWKKFIDEKDDLSFSIVYDTYVEVLYAYGSTWVSVTNCVKMPFRTFSTTYLLT